MTLLRPCAEHPLSPPTCAAQQLTLTNQCRVIGQKEIVFEKEAGSTSSSTGS
jgi:hypothetical protein